VEATSTIHDESLARLDQELAGGARIVGAILHQDCVVAPWFFRARGFATLVNIGDAGDVASALLRRCAIEPVRGGSSTRASRYLPLALRDLIRWGRARAERGFVIAMMPDGSRGPAGGVKPGLMLLAAQTGADLWCAKVHARRAILAGSWDRTLIPLPFNEIWVDIAGPIPLAGAHSRQELETLRVEVEGRLHQLHHEAWARCWKPPNPVLTRWVADED
jgi:lysophospholipid acyltransferase (LPLAT)-like uncharacterized protein